MLTIVIKRSPQMPLPGLGRQTELELTLDAGEDVEIVFDLDVADHE